MFYNLFQNIFLIMLKRGIFIYKVNDFGIHLNKLKTNNPMFCVWVLGIGLLKYSIVNKHFIRVTHIAPFWSLGLYRK